MIELPYEPPNIQLLSTSSQQQLIRYVLDNQRHVLDHVSAKGIKDGTSYIATPELYRIISKDLVLLRRSCALYFEPSVVLIRPGVKVARHRDGRKSARMCNVISHLYPAKEIYAPLRFWKHETAKEPYCELTAEKLPALVNIQELHDVVNNDMPRFNFQLAFGVPFNQVLALHRKGELFK